VRGWEQDLRPVVPAGDLCRTCLRAGLKEGVLKAHPLTVPALSASIHGEAGYVPAAPPHEGPCDPVPFP
jgi:hypothetical protein